MKNKKGFTLIELLAVIIILGILMVIAIPAVTNYITKSRKEAYITTAKSYSDAMRIKVNEMSEYKFTDEDTVYYIHVNNIVVERGGKSPFGEWIDAYVVVIIEDNKYEYYWTSVDEAGYKVILKISDKIESDDVKTDGKKSVSNTKTIGYRSKAYIIDKDGNIIETDATIELDEEEAYECYVYTISNNEVTINGYRNNCSRDVVIPNKIEGYPVTSIGANAFRLLNITSIKIPNTVKSIGSAAFSNNKLTEINIPNSVTSIGTAAFSNNLLTEVTLPSSVTSIGGGAFSNNAFPEESAMIYGQYSNGTPDYSKLLGYGGNAKDIIIPDTKEGVALKTIAAQAFRNFGITSVVIPNSVEAIESMAFNDNKLTTINLPSNLRIIGSGAFRSNNLTSLVIPNGVTSLGRTSFNDNQLPSSQAFIYARNSGGSVNYSMIVSYGGADRNPVIPSVENGVQLKTLDISSFAYNTLTGVTIPSTVTMLDRAFNHNLLPDEQAFIYARNSDGSINNSKIVSYGGANKNPVIPDGVTVIGSDTFTETSITSVQLPESLNTIGNNAFASCKLTKVTIPANVTIIGVNAFKKERSWADFNMLTTIVNKTGKSFDWKSITGGNYTATFETGTIRHQISNIQVVAE